MQKICAGAEHDGVCGCLLSGSQPDGRCVSAERGARAFLLVHFALEREPLVAQRTHGGAAELRLHDREELPAFFYEIRESFRLFRRAGEILRAGVRAFGGGEIYTLVFGVFFLAELGRDQQPQDIYVTQVVRLSHERGKLELLFVHGRIYILRAFERREFRSLLFADDEPYLAAGTEGHGDSAAHRDIIPLVVERSVYFGGGNVNDDFKDHSTPRACRG